MDSLVGPSNPVVWWLRCHDLVQDRTEVRRGWQIAQLIEHEHVAGEEWAQEPLPPHRGGGATNVGGQSLGRDEACRGPELDLFGGNGDREHRLAESRWPHQGE